MNVNNSGPSRGTRCVGWEVRGWSFKRRPRDRYAYVGLVAYLRRINLVGDPVGRAIHRVEVSASPTGRSVQVYVDGVRYVPAVDR